MANILTVDYGDNEGVSTNWTLPSGSATLSNSTDFAITGTKALKALTSNSSAIKVAIAYSSRITCAPSTAYTTQWSARATTSRWLAGSIDWYDSGGSYISTDVLDMAGNTNTGAWATSVDTTTSPSTAASFTLGYDWDSNSTSASLYLDNLSVDDGTTYISAPTRLEGPGVHNSSDVNSYTTGSFTPTAGRLLVCSLSTQNQLGQLQTATGTMTISQTHSGTWTWTYLSELFDLNTGSSYYGRNFIAYAVVPATPGAGTITYTFNTGSGGTSKNRNIIIENVYEIDGVDQTNPVVQAITGRSTTSTSVTITYPVTPGISAMSISNVGNSYDTSDTNIAVPTNYTELHENSSADATNNQQLCTAYDLSSVGTSVNWTTLSNLYGAGAIALELRSALTGSSPPAGDTTRRAIVIS